MPIVATAAVAVNKPTPGISAIFWQDLSLSSTPTAASPYRRSVRPAHRAGPNCSRSELTKTAGNRSLNLDRTPDIDLFNAARPTDMTSPYPVSDPCRQLLCIVRNLISCCRIR